MSCVASGRYPYRGDNFGISFMSLIAIRSHEVRHTAWSTALHFGGHTLADHLHVSIVPFDRNRTHPPR